MYTMLSFTVYKAFKYNYLRKKYFKPYLFHNKNANDQSFTKLLNSGLGKRKEQLAETHWILTVSAQTNYYSYRAKQAIPAQRIYLS